MIENAKNTQQEEPTTAKKEPNENGKVSVEGFIRITDPNTKEIFVEKRA